MVVPSLVVNNVPEPHINIYSRQGPKSVFPYTGNATNIPTLLPSHNFKHLSLIVETRDPYKIKIDYGTKRLLNSKQDTVPRR